MKYLKLFEEFNKLYESECDVVQLPSGKYITEQDPDSIPFFDIDDVLYVGQYASTHDDIVLEIEKETGEEHRDIWKKTRKNGRMWQKSKVFSFNRKPSCTNLGITS